MVDLLLAGGLVSLLPRGRSRVGLPTHRWSAGKEKTSLLRKLNLAEQVHTPARVTTHFLCGTRHSRGLDKHRNERNALAPLLSRKGRPKIRYIKGRTAAVCRTTSCPARPVLYQLYRPEGRVAQQVSTPIRHHPCGGHTCGDILTCMFVVDCDSQSPPADAADLKVLLPHVPVWVGVRGRVRASRPPSSRCACMVHLNHLIGPPFLL